MAHNGDSREESTLKMFLLLVIPVILFAVSLVFYYLKMDEEGSHYVGFFLALPLTQLVVVWLSKSESFAWMSIWSTPPTYVFLILYSMGLYSDWISLASLLWIFVLVGISLYVTKILMMHRVGKENSVNFSSFEDDIVNAAEVRPFLCMTFFLSIFLCTSYLIGFGIAFHDKKIELEKIKILKNNKEGLRERAEKIKNNIVPRYGIYLNPQYSVEKHSGEDRKNYYTKSHGIDLFANNKGLIEEKPLQNYSGESLSPNEELNMLISEDNDSVKLFNSFRIQKIVALLTENAKERHTILIPSENRKYINEVETAIRDALIENEVAVDWSVKVEGKGQGDVSGLDPGNSDSAGQKPQGCDPLDVLKKYYPKGDSYNPDAELLINNNNSIECIRLKIVTTIEFIHFQEWLGTERFTLMDYFYFAVYTITTTGYGDMIPYSKKAKVIVTLANLIELFFIVIFFNTLLDIGKKRKVQRENSPDDLLDALEKYFSRTKNTVRTSGGQRR